MGTAPPEQAGDDGPAGDLVVLLPFELYAPGWQAGWGRALRDADPRERPR